MSTVHVYDPALCCSSGVCGQEVDPALVAAASTFAQASASGVEIVRHNLAQEPADFASEPAIKELLEDEGVDALPAIVVDGVLKLTGEYPTAQQLCTWAGVPSPRSVLTLTETTGTSGGCCCGGEGCC